MSKKRHHRRKSGPAGPSATPPSEAAVPRRSPARWALVIAAIAAIAWIGAPRLFRAEPPPSPIAVPAPATPHPVTLPTPPRPNPSIRPAHVTDLPEGIEVRAALSEIPAALRLVWIGDMHARVDACTCGKNLRLPFVAPLLRRLAGGAPPTVLLDVGGAIAGDSPLDRARQEAYLAALKDLGFASVAVGAGRGYLPAEPPSSLVAAGPPLLTLGSPALDVPLGDRSIALVCVDSPPLPMPRAGPRPPTLPPWTAPDAAAQASAAIAPLRARGDIVVLLGDISREDADRIAALAEPPDVILSSRPIVSGGTLSDTTRHLQYEDFLARVGRTWLLGLPASSFGGVRSLELAADGAPVAYGMYQPSTTHAPDPQVAARAEAFMRRLETDPTLSSRPPRRFASEARENDAADAYVGTDACVRCHAKQGTQWRTTRHSMATKELENIDRHFDPDCITCHSTGYGYPSGYRLIPEERHALRDVGCETCHGPGKRHSDAPKDRALIRRGSSTLCIECHDGRDAKPLGDGLERAYEGIRH